MSSMTKAARVLALLEALQDQPSVTGPELATRLGIDVRTVRRDVVSLQDSAFPSRPSAGRPATIGCDPDTACRR